MIKRHFGLAFYENYIAVVVEKVLDMDMTKKGTA
jgi:hypothetical protein